MSKILVLKSKYEGLRVTRSDIRIGKITFDANTVKQEHYRNYYDLGFVELFEEVEDIEIDVIVPNNEKGIPENTPPTKKVSTITNKLVKENGHTPTKKRYYNNGNIERRYTVGKQPKNWVKGRLKN